MPTFNINVRVSHTFHYYRIYFFGAWRSPDNVNIQFMPHRSNQFPLLYRRSVLSQKT